MRSSLCFAMEITSRPGWSRKKLGQGKLFGVWNTDGSNDLRLIHRA